MTAGRYHSLIAHPDLPDEFEVSATLRRRRDGGAPPRAAGRGRPVPPRVDPDARRQEAARRTSSEAKTAALMPNEILTRAIDSVASGTHLTADHASAVLDEIMEGRASEVQTAAFLIALRAKGETVAELTGLARTMRRARVVGRYAAATAWSTRPGPGAGRRPSTSRPRPRSSRRAPAARSQSTATARTRAAPARPTCWRRWACRSSSSRRRSRVDRGDRLRLHVRAAPSRGDEARGASPQGARRPDDLQLPGAADQPGRRDAASSWASRIAATRRRSPRRSRPSAASARSWSPPRTGSTSSRSQARPASSRWRTAPRRSGSSRPADVGLVETPLEEIAGGSPEDNAAVVEAVLDGDDGPGSRRRRPQRRRGDPRRRIRDRPWGRDGPRARGDRPRLPPRASSTSFATLASPTG